MSNAQALGHRWRGHFPVAGRKRSTRTEPGRILSVGGVTGGQPEITEMATLLGITHFAGAVAGTTGPPVTSWGCCRAELASDDQARRA